MNRITHCCLDVRGALKSFKRQQLASLFQGLNADQARERLLDCVAAGYEVIPFGPACDGFDYVTGCPGHPVEIKPIDTAAIGTNGGW